ncbi:hypothetical protein LPTSP4_09500 [Leptospira ryugenii]|uniref:Uncharacterized protein n=1 Tax=Leptospira ryugenii TaxID=1917863 RepID=A0A2P2DXT2_9LEPT|nr:hypothetical protein [Leptospira ryugenii]GBF49437.1 hypothetical protein LPTSP4_09500 [Leptospira ryugenii]
MKSCQNLSIEREKVIKTTVGLSSKVKIKEIGKSITEVIDSILTTPHERERGYRSMSIRLARKVFCTIGTNRVKRRLTKRSFLFKEARLLRNILDIEDANLNAKRYFGITSRNYYDEKVALLRTLVSLADDLNLTHGFSLDENQPYHRFVYYLEFKGFQFSWHFSETIAGVPNYEKPWDGVKNSTLGKLEMLILTAFPDILKN